MQVDTKTLHALDRVLIFADEVTYLLAHFGDDYDRDTPVDWLARRAMERCLQNIGAAVRDGIPKGHPYRVARTEIPWSDIAGLRNVMAYAYEIVDHGLMWDVPPTNSPDSSKSPKCRSVGLSRCMRVGLLGRQRPSADDGRMGCR